MSNDERQATLQQPQDMSELSAWLAAHEQEVAAFERHLRKLAPQTRRQELVRVILESVEHEEQE